MNREEKREEIEYLTGCFTKAQIALCGDSRGLTVAQVTKLRKELRKSGAHACVVKNTLGRISVENVHKGKVKDGELSKFVDTLAGPSFVVFADGDPVAPAKTLTQFAKENEKFKVKGALFEGAFVDSGGVEMLSKMPGRAETLASLLRVINGPATQLVRLLQAPGSQVVRLIEAQRKEIEKKAA